jgi:CheY-like chemotaxis protein
VWDTGIGIPDEQRARIFEEFQRLDHPPRRQEKGFGLGLAIVQRIARQLSLDVTVRSSPGRGSCFAVRVPAGRVQAKPSPQAASGPSPAESLAGLRIICIEDDARTRQALDVLLRGWSCEPAFAASLEEALVTLARWPKAPDVILAGYRLEDGAYGTDAVAAIRNQACCAIPAIVISGDRGPSLQSDLRRFGYGFLSKPVQPAKLRAMMVYVLSAESIPISDRIPHAA